jgi:hypothetical protein
MDNIHSKWRSTNGWQTVDFKTRQNFGEAQGKDSFPQATPHHKTPYLVAARPHRSGFSLPPLPSPDPVAAYLSRLAPTSRITMRKLLMQIARLLAPTLSAANLSWPQLRYADTLRLRDQLSTRYAPATANLALAGTIATVRGTR